MGELKRISLRLMDGRRKVEAKHLLCIRYILVLKNMQQHFVK